MGYKVLFYIDYPKGPCTQIAYALDPKYLYRDCCKAKVYTIWVPGPLRTGFRVQDIVGSDMGPKPYLGIRKPTVLRG